MALVLGKGATEAWWLRTAVINGELWRFGCLSHLRVICLVGERWVVY